LPREKAAKSFYDPAGKSGRALNAHLLTKDCPRRQFETIPAARDSQARLSVNPPRQHRVGSQALYDIRPVCTQIKHGANSLGNKKKRTRIAKLNTYGECVVSFVE
jgi:hypothetical protein